MRYPWTVSQWQQIQSRRQRLQLPHALLFTGMSGLGKLDVAADLAKSMLCSQPSDNGLACGQCRSCMQFKAGTHPDYQLITSEEPGKQIKIDQIRELIEQFTLASHQGGYRVAIISPAENMNIAAANSLLKTLEEPPANTLLILVCERPHSLPLTVLSRCQLVKFIPPDQQTSIEWLNNAHFIEQETAQSLLAIAGNSPLKALECAQSDQLALRDVLFSSLRRIVSEGEPALQAAKPWLKLELPGPINWLYSWISDLIRIKLQPRAELINRDLSSDLYHLAQRVDLEGLFQLQDELTMVLRKQRAPFNLQLLYEHVLLGWERISTQADRG